MTHDKLSAIGAKWLRKHDQNITVPNCNVILSDFHTAHRGRPDIIGFNSYDSVLIEVKVSRSDFLADKEKELRREPHREVGEYRYYLCPEEMIQPDEIPKYWGLLWWNDNLREMRIVKRADLQPKTNMKGERMMLVSLLRRAGVKGNL